ncbi:MAG TPA: DUF6603 domain-containing protein, partial [Solirubrobacteraceae bacterium]
DIDVVFRPDDGSLVASALLASDSYVLTKDAHLTGGFAFCSWFGDNEHAGDFVLTIGGYHPSFQAPAHYPSEPRLGIDWPVSDEISIVGTAYYAVTPSAAMVGAGLSVTFEAGPLKAWLKAQADILVEWKPFYVDGRVSVSVGASMEIHVAFVHITVSVEIGCDFHIFGPEIGFSVHIDWHIISFTIDGGASPGHAPAVDWDGFKAMLPADGAGTNHLVRAAAANGLITTHEADGATAWLVAQRGTRLQVACAVPVRAVNVQAGDKTDPVQGTQIAIAPMLVDAQDVTSTLTVTLSAKTDGRSDAPPDIDDWTIAPITQPVPLAIWGTPSPDAPALPQPGADQTVDAVVGITLTPPDVEAGAATPILEIDEVFADRTITPDDTQLPFPADVAAAPPPTLASTFAAIAQANSTPVAAARTALHDALAPYGFAALPNGTLDKTAGDPGLSFVDEPLEGTAYVLAG